jgi:hypothetical protein
LQKRTNVIQLGHDLRRSKARKVGPLSRSRLDKFSQGGFENLDAFVRHGGRKLEMDIYSGFGRARHVYNLPNGFGRSYRVRGQQAERSRSGPSQLTLDEASEPFDMVAVSPVAANTAVV